MSATTFAVAMPAQRPNVTSGSKRRYGRSAAWAVSALLHILLIWLALYWIAPHESRAPVGRQIGPIISLGEMLKADQSGAAAAAARPAARPHASKPTHRQASRPPAAAPSPQPQPTEVAQAAVPQPQAAADPGPPAPAADAAPAASAQGASSAPAVEAEIPWAYLTQISQMINAHLGRNHPSCIGHKRQSCQVATVHLCLDRSGAIVSAGLVGSAGSRDFDQAALDAIHGVGTFPPPPADVMQGVSEFVVDQPVMFYRG